MIYFIQRKEDNLITFGVTHDLDATLKDISEEYGEINLLGVMEGGIKEQLNKWQQWGHFKQEGEDDWVWDFPEVVDWISHNTTPDISGVKSSAQYKTSQYTPIKQKALDSALRQQINIVTHITKAWNKPKPYLYYDLYAGPGIDKNGEFGSPLIFANIASRYAQRFDNFDFVAHFFEADKNLVSELNQNISNDKRISVHDDHFQLMERLNEIEHETSAKERQWTYGAVYADPSNADLPWDLLKKFNQVFPKIDIMINIACASYKRTISQIGYKTLAERLPQIKTKWIVRRPFGKHQWSILIGSNWKKYPAWKKHGFYPWKNDELGEYYFERLVYTKEQRTKAKQKKLL